MNKYLRREILIDIATTLGTDPAFLEKDFYVCHVIKGLSENLHGRFEPIFCGGTSLLLGYRVINRFSEDIDFRIIPLDERPATRNDRREYRESLLKTLTSIPDIHIIEKSLISRDESRFFKVEISYPKLFEGHDSMRSEIKLEGTFEGISTDNSAQLIRPIMSDYTDVDCVTSIKCLSLHETTADKISALTWRILKRDSNEDDRDATVIRHLYDIYALVQNLEKNIASVVTSATTVYQNDRKRKGGNEFKTLRSAMIEVLKILKSNPAYKQAYNQYVKAMCFGVKSPTRFEDTLITYEKLIKIIPIS